MDVGRHHRLHHKSIPQLPWYEGIGRKKIELFQTHATDYAKTMLAPYGDDHFFLYHISPYLNDECDSNSGGWGNTYQTFILTESKRLRDAWYEAMWRKRINDNIAK